MSIASGIDGLRKVDDGQTSGRVQDVERRQDALHHVTPQHDLDVAWRLFEQGLCLAGIELQSV